MIKITLQLNGREMTFSESELIAILKTHFSNKTTELVDVPKEGKKFKVKPTDINRKLFQKERTDIRQEETRQLILESFTKLDSNPEKYGRSFTTQIPERKGLNKKGKELKDQAKKLGGHMADWVEQALEWAQRINNGESWETVCNKAETSNWCRAIIWKNGCIKLIGGSLEYDIRYASSFVFFNDYDDDYEFNTAVPLIVCYDEEV